MKAVEARALLALGRLPDARGRFAELFHAGTNAEARADGRLGLALCAANGNLQAAALEELQALAGGESPGWGAAVAAFGWAGALDSGKAPGLASADEHARAAYQKALTSDALPAELERICQARLEALTEKIVLSPARRHALGAPKAVFHAVEPGQSLYQIARQHGVSIGQLCRLNQLDRNGFLRVGQTLKVLPGEARLVVDRWRLTATLFCDGAYLRRWPVGIGPGEATPSGRFTIRTKLVNPDWYYGGKKDPLRQSRKRARHALAGLRPRGGRRKGRGHRRPRHDDPRKRPRAGEQGLRAHAQRFGGRALRLAAARRDGGHQLSGAEGAP
ncbi:MAG: LysM peptidoglycan-binding domain-containing protein [Planctomycetota bacterium]|nr:LysM peptidoglycan-binding domain-containing protein [Planctomycetota bacterium]